MKTKQSDHCAHVAAHYVNESITMSNGTAGTFYGLPALQGQNYFFPASPAYPAKALMHLETAIKYLRVAIKFWRRAGGRPGQIREEWCGGAS